LSEELGPDERRALADDFNPSLVQRLQAASYALPLVEHMRDIADEVYDLDTEGATEAQIDAHIGTWLEEHGYSYEYWRAEMEEDFAGTALLDKIDMRKLWKGYGVEAWARECIRSIAFTDQPIPFLAFAAGFWLEYPDTDPPTLVAVMTPLSDPKLAAKQLVDKHRKLFGQQASGSPRAAEVANARMLARHREGMSYTDIAIQNLREKHPDIVTRPHKYKADIKREKERVAKAIPAAQKLWKERGLDSSTPE